MDVSDLARHGARDVVIEPYPERGWNARMTDMQAALGLCQLELLDEILRAPLAWPSATTRRSARFPASSLPTTRSTRSVPGSPTAVRLTPGAPVGSRRADAALLDDGIATRRGVMAIQPSGIRRQPAIDLPHTEAATRDVADAAAVPGAHRRAAGLRHRAAGHARNRARGVSPYAAPAGRAGGFARETLELVRAINGSRGWEFRGLLDDDPAGTARRSTASRCSDRPRRCMITLMRSSPRA